MENWKVTYLGDGVVQIPGHPAVGCFARNTTASVVEAVAQSVKDHSQWSIIRPDGTSWPVTTLPTVTTTPTEEEQDLSVESTENQPIKKTRNSRRFGPA